MTIEEALEILDTIPTIGEQVDALEMAIKALEQEPCEDAISRQAVLKQLKGCLTGGDTEYEYVKLHIDSIPSVSPARPKGSWYIRDTEPLECECWDCSECKETVFEKTNYCPNCGADMAEKEDKE